MSTRACLPSHLRSSPGPAVSGGLLNQAGAPAQGGFPHPCPWHPQLLWRCPLPRLAGVPGFQFTSSRAREGEGGELRPARPHLPSQTQNMFMVTAKGRPGHWVERAVVAGGGARCGVEEFHLYSQHTLGISGGRGALGHSPSMKGNQTVNGNVGRLLPLSLSASVSPWKPLAL